MSRRKVSPEEQLREVSERSEQLGSLASKLRMVEDCLERAQGALEGQVFQSGRNANYVIEQLERAEGYVREANELVSKCSEGVQDAPIPSE